MKDPRALNAAKLAIANEAVRTLPVRTPEWRAAALYVLDDALAELDELEERWRRRRMARAAALAAEQRPTTG